MIGEIIKAEPAVTKSGRDVIKFTILVDGDITIVYLSPDLPVDIFKMHLEYLDVEIVDNTVDTDKFVHKLVPMTKDQFRGRIFDTIDWLAVRNLAAQIRVDKADSRLKLIADDIDLLCKKHQIDYEDFLRIQASLAKRDAERQDNDLVQSVLFAMAQDLESAAFNYYASFK